MTDLTTLATMMGISITTLVILIVVQLWDGVWKLIALWKSARKKQLPWFIVLAIINSAGILPILYIFIFSKLDKKSTAKKKKK